MSIASRAMATVLGMPGKAIIQVNENQPRGGGFGGKVQLPTAATVTPQTPAFAVQYNPSSLNIVATARETCIKSMQQGADANALLQTKRPPSFVLTVQLLFDQTQNMDAFPGDITTIQGSAFPQMAVGIGLSLGKNHSVQPEMDAIQALMMTPQCRTVTFYWGEMAFSGQVKYLTSKYTLFSAWGRPVRGTMDFQIFQVLDGQNTNAYWAEAYKRIKDGKFDRSLVEDVAKTLLNLPV